MRKIINLIAGIFSFSKATETNYQKAEAKRNKVSNVKAGDVITIEHHRVSGKIGNCTCINNDVITRKLLIEFKWSNYEELKCPEKERFILDYDATELKNFNLLNPLTDNEEGDNLSKLKNDLQAAIDNEEYEVAAKIRDEIKRLTS